MGYIDDNLMSEEQVIYRTKLHWITLLIPAILAIFFGLPAIPAILDIFFGSFVFGSFLLLVAIICGIPSFISFKNSEFAITNKRVLMNAGFIRINSLEIPLTKVEAIQVKQGPLGRILNYGTVIITGTGGTAKRFRDIYAPLEFRKKLQEQIALKEQ